jgi:hypothetical protein
VIARLRLGFKKSARFLIRIPKRDWRVINLIDS